MGPEQLAELLCPLVERFGPEGSYAGLLEAGIATRRGIMCAHREAAYPSDSWRSAGALQASEKAQDECILLPLYHQLKQEEQQLIVDQLRAVLKAQCTA